MNASPITSWDGAEAYFTFADSPGVIAVILIVSVAITVFAIGSAIKHEAAVYKAYAEKDE